MDKKKKSTPRVRSKRHKPSYAQKRTKPAVGEGDVIIYGVHAVKAALMNDERRIKKMLLTKNALSRLSSVLERRDLVPEIVEPDAINALTGPEAIHQGMALIASSLEGSDIHDIEEARLLVVLDQVTDPHNVGAIIRSAVALGADGLVTTKRHAPQETGLLAKTASGGLDLIKLVHVGNLSQAIEKLNEFGFSTIGLDSEGPLDLKETLSGDKIALVMGAEGSGLRRLTRERCQYLARLDMPGAIKSLNVSNAAVLSLHLATAHLAKGQ